MGDVTGTQAYEATAIALVDTGLVVTGVWDIWGQSRSVLLYVEPSTVRIVEAGFAVLTSRASLQRGMSAFYAGMVQGLRPMSGRRLRRYLWRRLVPWPVCWLFGWK